MDNIIFWNASPRFAYPQIGNTASVRVSGGNIIKISVYRWMDPLRMIFLFFLLLLESI